MYGCVSTPNERKRCRSKGLLNTSTTTTHTIFFGRVRISPTCTNLWIENDVQCYVMFVSVSLDGIVPIHRTKAELHDYISSGRQACEKKSGRNPGLGSSGVPTQRRTSLTTARTPIQDRTSMHTNMDGNRQPRKKSGPRKNLSPWWMKQQATYQGETLLKKTPSD